VCTENLIKPAAPSSRLGERSQYAENQLEQILHQVANLPRLFSASMLNRIFGTHNHESLNNLTPRDVYFGTGQAILEKRQRIKSKTIQQRRALHQNSKAA